MSNISNLNNSSSFVEFVCEFSQFVTDLSEGYYKKAKNLRNLIDLYHQKNHSNINPITNRLITSLADRQLPKKADFVLEIVANAIDATIRAEKIKQGHLLAENLCSQSSVNIKLEDDVIEISDRGDGIDIENLYHLFVPNSSSNREDVVYSRHLGKNKIGKFGQGFQSVFNQFKTLPFFEQTDHLIKICVFFYCDQKLHKVTFTKNLEQDYSSIEVDHNICSFNQLPTSITITSRRDEQALKIKLFMLESSTFIQLLELNEQIEKGTTITIKSPNIKRFSSTIAKEIEKSFVLTKAVPISFNNRLINPTPVLHKTRSFNQAMDINQTLYEEIPFQGGSFFFKSAKEQIEQSSLVVCEAGKKINEYCIPVPINFKTVVLNFDRLDLTPERASINFNDLVASQSLENGIRAIQNSDLRLLEKAALLNALQPILGPLQFNLMPIVKEWFKSLKDTFCLPYLPAWVEMKNLIYLHPDYIDHINLPILFAQSLIKVYQLDHLSQPFVSTIWQERLHVIVNVNFFNDQSTNTDKFNWQLLIYQIEKQYGKEYGSQISSAINQLGLSLDDNFKQLNKKSIVETTSFRLNKVDPALYQKYSAEKIPFKSYLPSLNLEISEFLLDILYARKISEQCLFLIIDLFKANQLFFNEKVREHAKVFISCLALDVMDVNQVYTIFDNSFFWSLTDKFEINIYRNAFFNTTCNKENPITEECVFLLKKAFPQMLSFFKTIKERRTNYFLNMNSYYNFVVVWNWFTIEKDYEALNQLNKRLFDINPELANSFSLYLINLKQKNIHFFASLNNEELGPLCENLLVLLEVGNIFNGFKKLDFALLRHFEQRYGNHLSKTAKINSLRFFCSIYNYLFVFRCNLNAWGALTVLAKLAHNQEMNKEMFLNWNNFLLMLNQLMFDLHTYEKSLLYNDQKGLEKYGEFLNDPDYRDLHVKIGSRASKSNELEILSYKNEFYLAYMLHRNQIPDNIKPIAFALLTREDAFNIGNDYVFPNLDPAPQYLLHKDPELLQALGCEPGVAKARIAITIKQNSKKGFYFGELIEQAMKAKATKIWFKCYCMVEGQWILEVRDNGCGMGEGFKEFRIPYYTTKGEKKQQPNEGEGGLSILSEFNEVVIRSSQGKNLEHLISFKKLPNEEITFQTISEESKRAAGTTFILKKEIKEDLFSELIALKAQCASIVGCVEGIEVYFDSLCINSKSSRVTFERQFDYNQPSCSESAIMKIQIGPQQSGVYGLQNVKMKEIQFEYLELVPKSIQQIILGKKNNLTIFLPNAPQLMNKGHFIDEEFLLFQIQRNVFVTSLYYTLSLWSKGLAFDLLPDDYWHNFNLFNFFSSQNSTNSTVLKLKEVIENKTWNDLIQSKFNSNKLVILEEFDKFFNQLELFRFVSFSEQAACSSTQELKKAILFYDSSTQEEIFDKIKKSSQENAELIELLSLLEYFDSEKGVSCLQNLRDAIQDCLIDNNLIELDGSYCKDFIQETSLDELEGILNQAFAEIDKDYFSAELIIQRFKESIFNFIKLMKSQQINETDTEKTAQELQDPCLLALEQFFVKLAKKVFNQDVKVLFCQKMAGIIAQAQTGGNTIYINTESLDLINFRKLYDNKDFPLSFILNHHHATIISWLETLAHEIIHLRESEDCQTHDQQFKEALRQLMLNYYIKHETEDSLLNILCNALQDYNDPVKKKQKVISALEFL